MPIRIAASFILPGRPVSRTRARMLPFESGVSEGAPSREKRFTVSFYLTAILFILFDLEIAFLFPWAATLNDIGFAGFIVMMIFLAILTVGFIYEWMKGALEWE